METIKEITYLIAFVKVGEQASFSKAAEKMGVSKSHLSKLIFNLEKKLKSPLFIRTTRSVNFTDFGKSLYKMCKDHVFEMEKIAKQVGAFAQIPKGTIRITVAGAYGEEIVSPLIVKLQSRYPSITTELIFSEQVLDLKKEKIDLAIRVSPTKPRDGLAVQIGERKEFVCASPAFLKQQGGPQKPQDLKKFNCLCGATEIWSFQGKKRTQKVKVAGRFKTANGRSLAQAAASGLGIVKLPEVYVEKFLAAGDLIPLLEDFTRAPMPIWGVTPFQKEVPQLVQLALQELKENRRLR